MAKRSQTAGSGQAAPLQSEVTDLVVLKFPDDALRRRKAYLQALARIKPERRASLLGPERSA